MHDAAPWPEGQLPSALILDPAAQIAIGCKQNWSVGRQLAHEIHGVTAGADQIALGLHRRTAIDVTHHEVVGMLSSESGKRISRAVICQGAAGLQIWQQNSFLRAEDLGGLGHEVHAAEHDHVRIGVSGFAR